MTGDRVGPSPLRSPAVLLALPVAFFAQAILGSTAYAVNYPPAQASAANGTMVVIAPFVAACAAWETFPLRLLWGWWPVGRPWYRALAGRLSLPLGAGAAIVALMYAAVVRGVDWRFPALTALGLVAWAAFGAAVALVAARWLALPVAVLVPYLLLVLPAGWEPLWLRHLNGQLFDCCDTGQVLDARAFTASLGVLGAVLVVSLCVVAVRLTPAGRAVTVPVAVAVTAVVAAVLTAAPVTALGASPGRPRDPAALDCRAGICLWPEDSRARTANATAWSAVREAWTGLGLPAPVGDIAPVDGHGRLGVATRGIDVAGAELSMAVALPRAMSGCTDTYGDPARDARLDALGYLVAVRVGVAGDAIAIPSPVPDASDAAAIWAAVGRCDG